jgi:hypothetical protein
MSLDRFQCQSLLFMSLSLNMFYCLFLSLLVSFLYELVPEHGSLPVPVPSEFVPALYELVPGHVSLSVPVPSELVLAIYELVPEHVSLPVLVLSFMNWT